MTFEEKKNLIHIKAQNINNVTNLLDAYNDLVRITIWEYNNDPRLSKLSSNYDVAMLPQDFQDYAMNLISDNNFIFFLIDKMLNRDATIAYSMYSLLYKQSHPELILNDGEIFLDDDQIEVYIDKGGNLAALTEMTAELWLNSPIGKSYLIE